SASRLSVRVAAPNKAIAVIGAKLGGCGIRRLTAASSTAPAMTDERGERNRKALMEAVLSAEPGKRGLPSAIRQRGRPGKADCDPACQMLKAEASGPFLGRQVFWLAALSGFRTAFPRSAPAGVVRSGAQWFGAWPVTAAVPQRICTVFPFSPPFGEEDGHL